MTTLWMFNMPFIDATLVACCGSHHCLSFPFTVFRRHDRTRIAVRDVRGPPRPRSFCHVDHRAKDARGHLSRSSCPPIATLPVLPVVVPVLIVSLPRALPQMLSKVSQPPLQIALVLACFLSAQTPEGGPHCLTHFAGCESFMA